MFRRYPGTLLVVAMLSFAFATASTQADNPPKGKAEAKGVVDADLCIYGGTSGGVVATLQASRLGKSVVLVEPTQHLGGMSSGGLGWVDFGNKGAVGGLSRDFFKRVGAKYGKPEIFELEPHVAEAVFDEMAAESKATVLKGQRLAEVKKEGPRLTEIVTSDGTRVRAKMFIDATYEGDLLARSGAEWTIGREANSQYGETVNGIQKPATNPRAGKFEFPVDPYKTPGDPKSGLLPLLLQAGELGTIGSADKLVQSYNYRVCLTDDPANRKAIDPPAHYSEADYELLARYIEAQEKGGKKLQLHDFLKYDPLPNRKFDFNNRWPISTDFIGGGASGYAEATPEERRQIEKAHEDYLRGFFHFLATSPRSPERVREKMSTFGLAKDEFKETGNWPHQIYVREARRMVSDFVMTEQHVKSMESVPNPVGLGAYGIDIHAVRRIAHEGQAINEGSNGGHVPKPYPIAYEAIVPRQSECENLLVPFCLSASHVAFGSIRMEPVFMSLSQVAATAAAQAIDGKSPVQKVDYRALRDRIVADGVVVEWIAKNSEPESNRNKAWESKQKGKKSNTSKPTTGTPKATSPTARATPKIEPHYDLVVVGGTPGGVACAVRAAREGLQVLLVNHTKHLGGFMTSGAGGWEAPYDGLRSPLYKEVRDQTEQYYIEKYGKGSKEHLASIPSKKSRKHIDRAKVEPRVIEQLLDAMVAKEKNLTVLVGYDPIVAQRDGATIKGVTLAEYKGAGKHQVTAEMFADATYEGDLAALAKVPYRVGRESRSEYGEPHAGIIYTEPRHPEKPAKAFPADAYFGKLNIRHQGHSTGKIREMPGSGEADGAVMAYNYRLILTSDPENRVPLEKPANYDRETARSAKAGGAVPNLPGQKIAWNSGRLIGPHHAYPEGDWETRDRISAQYQDAILSLLWYLQNDPEVPEKTRQYWQRYGLAKDEFVDNGHLPYEIYVREARRIVGRDVFTEQDNVVAEGLGRTPICVDSIAVTDWPMDSVACSIKTLPGGTKKTEGIFFLGEESRPGQISYRTLLPKGVDNLLVPVCLSASHVGWGAVRLEPVWMQTGEAAGYAAALAHRTKKAPADIDSDELVRILASNHHMVSFFNDIDVESNNPVVAPIEYFGTKGFFTGYDARAEEPLTRAVAECWVRAHAAMLKGEPQDPMVVAQSVAKAEQASSEPLQDWEFWSTILRTYQETGLPHLERAIAITMESRKPITRGEACEILFERAEFHRKNYGTPKKAKVKQ